MLELEQRLQDRNTKMQKIIIRNLGPIANCEIELKNFVVFVGDSGTGKSVLLRTISMLQWIYKKMQYKVLLKHSNARADALRFRLDGLLRVSMLDPFFQTRAILSLKKMGKA